MTAPNMDTATQTTKIELSEWELMVVERALVLMKEDDRFNEWIDSMANDYSFAEDVTDVLLDKIRLA